MARITSGVLALCCWSSVCFAQAPARDNPNATPTGTAVIRGRVIVAGSDHPLSKVQVRAVSSALGVNKAAMTDGSGRYAIAELPAGKYVVSAAKPNYVFANFGERRPMGAGQPIDVADGKTIDRVDFALQRGGAITGKIVDEFGDPVADVQVVTMRYGYVNGERRMQPTGGFANTNDLGEFRLFGLQPGQFFVSATLRNNNFGSDTTDRTAYQPTYYPGTGNVAEAQRITIQSGQTVSGINMMLLPVTANRVSGVALDSNGRPMTGAFVSATQRGNFMGVNTGARVNADGTFTIAALPPGEYTLRAGNGAPETAVADVTVDGSDVTDVQLVVHPPSIMRGRIVFDRAPISLPAPTAVRISAMAISNMAIPGGVGGSTSANNDWTFEIKGGGGLVRVAPFVIAGPAPNPRPNPIAWRLKRVLVGDTDVTDSGFEWPVSGTTENVVVEMTTEVAEVDATVVDGAGSSVRDCVVLMFSPDSQRWVAQSRFYAVGRPDTEGVFHGRVPAGDYLIVAFDDPEPNFGVFMDPEVLSQLRDRATPVSAALGQKKAIQLTLSLPPVY
ncbi:MAG TPA: carboxypeptidase regulatory-like domain-containing protein [Vicinamibacterales bacterium]|nr:carboxypeptidase regulatory-like domain-containing protein [Vicinamibacterales bacterium]